MTKIERALENAHGVFDSHWKVCPRCQQYYGSTGSLWKLCLDGVKRCKAVLDAQYAIDTSKLKKASAKENRTERVRKCQ